ncbi:MAG: hypothetical protein ACLFMO_03950 [Eubacteriales bacterium]
MDIKHSKRIKANNNNNWKKNILKTLLITISIIVLFFCGILVYTYYSQFDIVEASSKRISREQIKVEDNIELKIILDEDSINARLKDIYFDREKPLGVESVQFNIKDKTISINGMYKSIPIPLNVKVEFKAIDNTIVIKPNGLTWGKWNIPLPMFQKKFEKHLNEIEYVSITREELNIPSFVDIKRINNLEDKVELVFRINEEMVEKLFNSFITNYNKEILLYYSQLDDSDYKLIYGIIESRDIEEKDIQLFLEDFIKDKALFEKLFVILEDEKVEEIFKEYKPYLNGLDKEEVYNIKANFLAEQRIKSSKAIFNTINLYEKQVAKKPFLRYGNKPYDAEREQFITVEFLKDFYNLPVSDNFIQRTGLVYDESKEKFVLAHFVNSHKVMIFYGEEEYEIISDYQYNNTYKKQDFEVGEKEFLKRGNKDRELIEDVLADYWETDKVFIRYLVSDNKNAYVIASHGYRYQTFLNFIMEKQEGKWKVLEVDINDIKEFNDKYPEINVKLLPNNIPDSSNIILLSYNDRLNIIENLYSEGLIENKNYNQLEYASFANDYIALMTADGEEFVYTVSYSFLDKLYTKDEAINLFNDLPFYITLQN